MEFSFDDFASLLNGIVASLFAEPLADFASGTRGAQGTGGGIEPIAAGVGFFMGEDFDPVPVLSW